MNHSISIPPKLAAPGAGLPKIELFIANLMIHWKARHTSREAAVATFAGEREAILRLIAGVSPDQLGKPVLIKRLQGLEDSSRYWSVLMTLDHLRIVNHEIAVAIASLCRGRIPAQAASIAGVKPDEKVDASVIAAFETASAEFVTTVAAQTNLRTAVKFSHPWFGPMDAAAWHFMTGFHMSLHRKQIQSILNAAAAS